MANWQPESSREIERRIVITGTLRLHTPVSLSSGETVGTEIVLLKDEREQLPLLPGASLAGALRHYLLGRELGYRKAEKRSSKKKTWTTMLFGEALDDGTQRMESRVIVHDALGDGQLTLREGVKIEGKTRTADEHMLFSTQVWEAGTCFNIRIELLLYRDDPDDLIAALAAGIHALGTGEIPLGGRKNRGYGRGQVKDWHVCEYKLHDPVDLSAWLVDEMPHDHTADFFAMADDFTDKRRFMYVEATLHLCDSLMIRSQSEVVDNEHLSVAASSDDDDTDNSSQAVLSGTSLTGALRARALKIANTVNPAHARYLVDNLFGKHGDDGNDLSASRVLVEEHAIEGGYFNYVQNRIKINRFTGGTFQTALLNQRPLFADDETIVRVHFVLRYPEDDAYTGEMNAQTGLLLLVLKDLWTEDLPLGGEASIGRGRLRGQHACLTFQFTDRDEQDSFTTEIEKHGLQNPDPRLINYLNKYVKDLVKYKKEPT